MIAEGMDFEVPYKDFERAALAVIHGEHRPAALSWLGELNQHVDEVIDGGDLESVAGWAARLDRLTANLPHGHLVELAAGYLAAMLDRLDRSAAGLAQERDVQERAEIATGVRARVLQLVMDQPRCRSGEIARRLGISASQASRALRELQQRGDVFLAEPDPADHDRRVHRYLAARAMRAA